MAAGTPRVEIQIETSTLRDVLSAEELLVPRDAITGISTDSRTPMQGTLFVALPGERVDGHNFVLQVANAGAAAVLVSQETALSELREMGCGVYLVKDTLQALQDLAAWHRRRVHTKIIGITGSVGKTSTKELCAAALSAAVGEHAVLRTLGNLNSQIGLPLMVLSIQAQHQYAVLEMGLSDFGEMERLSAIAQPDVAVLTAIAAAHLEKLGSLDGVAKAKAEIFTYLQPTGTAVLPSWDTRCMAIGEALRAKKQQVCWVGEDTGDVQIKEAASGTLRLSIAGETHETLVPLVGRHHVRNAALAIAAAVCAGANASDCARGIAETKIPGGRSRLATEILGLHVLDDSYNANPASMKAAIDSLSLLSGKRSVVLLGDMFELGIDEATDHREVGAYAAEKGVDLLLGFGKAARGYVDAASANGTRAVYLGTNLEDAQQLVRELVQKEDRVLLKGSRGMQMERFLKILQEIGAFE